MSRELDYFPPRGTKYKWSEKSIQNSPWFLNLTNQYFNDLNIYPLKAIIRVYLRDDTYSANIEFEDFNYKRSEHTISAKNPLVVCLEAEDYCEKWIRHNVKDWMITALRNGWRPPPLPGN